MTEVGAKKSESEATCPARKSIFSRACCLGDPPKAVFLFFFLVSRGITLVASAGVCVVGVLRAGYANAQFLCRVFRDGDVLLLIASGAG